MPETSVEMPLSPTLTYGSSAGLDREARGLPFMIRSGVRCAAMLKTSVIENLLRRFQRTCGEILRDRQMRILNGSIQY
jgi:hypothetical protein